MVSVRAVEKMDGVAFERTNMLQVVHDEGIMYMGAESQTQRNEW